MDRLIKAALTSFLFVSYASAEEPSQQLFDPQAVKDSCRVWVEGDLLFWQASLDGLGYAITSDSTTSILNGTVQNPSSRWSWGARAGIGYKIPRDQWDLFFNYTYFNGRATGSTSGSVLFPTIMAPFGLAANAYVTNGSANWKAVLNMGDIELGRNCIVGNWLSLRPFVGIRGAWINQRYNVTYSGGTAVPAGDQDILDYSNRFWGVGVRIGVDTLWGLGRGFGIYGNGAGSLLSGNFQIREREFLHFTGTTRLQVYDRLSNVVACAELALGLQWDCFFSYNRYHFGVKLGYEFEAFFNQNQWFNFLSGASPGLFARNNGDLGFQGVTLGLRLDF